MIFISWAKYAEKWVYDIPEKRFDKSAIITYVIQEPEEIRKREIKLLADIVSIDNEMLFLDSGLKKELIVVISER